MAPAAARPPGVSEADCKAALKAFADRAVGGDAGQLWYGTLRGLVNSGFRRIVGLTSHTDLLILETLAREAGLQVHSRNATGRLVSWVLI